MSPATDDSLINRLMVGIGTADVPVAPEAPTGEEPEFEELMEEWATQVAEMWMQTFRTQYAALRANVEPEVPDA